MVVSSCAYYDCYTDDYIALSLGQGYSAVMTVTANSQFNMVGLNSGVGIGANRLSTSDPLMGQLVLWRARRRGSAAQAAPLRFWGGGD